MMSSREVVEVTLNSALAGLKDGEFWNEIARQVEEGELDITTLPDKLDRAVKVVIGRRQQQNEGRK